MRDELKRRLLSRRVVHSLTDMLYLLYEADLQQASQSFKFLGFLELFSLSPRPLLCQVQGRTGIALRYFNVFGPRQDPHSQYAAVIPKFVTAMLNDSSRVIYGDGEQSRGARLSSARDNCWEGYK